MLLNIIKKFKKAVINIYSINKIYDKVIKIFKNYYGFLNLKEIKNKVNK